MTDLERIELLEQIEKDISVSSLDATFIETMKSCAIHSAIEELKQPSKKDCLKKLIEEIECMAYMIGSEYVVDVDIVKRLIERKMEGKVSYIYEKQCKNCKELGTVNCSETYREPTINDNACEDFSPERKYTYG